MNWLLYYCFVLPLSMLPLRILYVFSDALYLLFVTLIPYRKKVVVKNLKNSFANKSRREIKDLQRKFYRHFCDILVEGIKNLSISESNLRDRLKVVNPEIMEELYRKNKNVVLVSGHYNNWEWLISAQNFLFKHQAVGIGMPMSNKFWDEKVNERRQRFGMKVVHAKNFKEVVSKNSEKPMAVLTLSDQSPIDSRKSYWTKFLNQQTAVLFGAEQMAHSYDMAVVYFVIEKLKRGYYQMRLELITKDPSMCVWGEITEGHVRLLEEDIQRQPECWIWSHKRWKREIPADLEQLKIEQKNAFNTRFKIS
jgi:KDO2-lipid IV(A) lauroyltransferase